MDFQRKSSMIASNVPGPREFSVLLRKSTADVLESIFGGSGKDAVLHHLGQIALADDAATFHERLVAMFGTGSKAVEG